ncbi:MAG: sigma 54-interacting transcriptional regulator [Desulfobacterium sp.]|nr:sigma 54-interacting transcriptional regulator [Desulfobacterium sp.]
MNDHEMNAIWKKIVNTINDGLMFINPQGKIMMVNNAFETLTGYTAKEAVGMSCTRLGCEGCEKTMQADRSSAWCKLFEKGEQDMKKCRCLLKCKDGRFLPVLKNASILWNETRTEPVGVVETLTDISELTLLDEKIHILARQYDREGEFQGLIGRSSEMEKVFEMIRKAALSRAPVIILGESGTGKELVANAIHMCGERKNGPFIKLNCAALNEAVLESELFGHARGAFTGAYMSRIGRFEAADHGDFFLDEIGDIPMTVQTKLLRVLESGQFERVGDISPVRVDVRIITATNKDLERLIDNNQFRQDLFFRINVIPIHLPPLRDRKQDIPLLLDSFIRNLNVKTGKDVTGLSHDAMETVMDYSWPGNVRELKNAMEYSFVTVEGRVIQLEHLPKKINSSKISNHYHPLELGTVEPQFLSGEKAQLIRALEKTRGNQTRAAELLNINRVTVWNRMKKYGIDLKKVLSV